MTEKTTIYSESQFNHCPLCGEKVEHNEFKVKESKKNLEVKCSEHGVLILD